MLVDLLEKIGLRVGLLDRGKLAALGEPEALRAEVGGQVVQLEATDAVATAQRLRDHFGVEPTVSGDVVRFELEDAHERVVDLVTDLSVSIHSITVARPSLEDVFLRRTGRQKLSHA